MKIAVLKENAAGETRVAVTPDTVKKLVSMNCTVYIERGAGLHASISDEAFANAGAKLSKIPLELIADADIVLKVQPSFREKGDELDELALMKEGSVIVGLLSPYENQSLIQQYAKKRITSFAMEFIPRITRAQSMDVLSSQSNLAGYKAVLDAAAYYGRVIPMMMTAAGTIAPARVLVLGAGVAGLQAIATAKRLGAIVSAFDVRPAVKEQVESLGATFIEVPSEEAGETKGGYAKEMSDEYKRKQQALIHETLKKQDIVICTALIPGKKAPQLITEAMIADMKPGSVIVDMATGSGGNAAFSEKDKIVEKNGVLLIGHSNLAARLPEAASQLYARNLLNFITLIMDTANHSIAIPMEDEIIKGALLTHEGKVVHPALQSA